MKKPLRYQRLLPVLLAMAFVLFSAFPAGAEEILLEEEILEETQPVIRETESGMGEEVIPVETLPQELPVAGLWGRRSILSIAEAAAQSADTRQITTQGTLVFVSGQLAVLQDDSGGLRIYFPEVPALQPGDQLQVTGDRTGGFTVTSFEKTGRGEMPAVDTSLTEAPEDIRICLQGVTLGRRQITQAGTARDYRARLPEGIAVGDTVTAWGVLLDGVFYADTLQAQEPEPDPTEGQWNFYFGQLHAHTAVSDGMGTPAEAYQYAKETAELDFFAITDHSDSFRSTDWEAGRAAAREATQGGDFLALWGYEMSWPHTADKGHISTFFSPDWLSVDQPGLDALPDYYRFLAQQTGSVSQFNHPGENYGDFQNFAGWDSTYDSALSLLEVGGESGSWYYESYIAALDRNWHVAPTNNQSNHDKTWGTASEGRTVILARELTAQALQEAMGSRRVYASMDRDLKVLYTLNGAVMGSILPADTQISIEARISDPTDRGTCLAEVVSRGGTVVTQGYPDPDTGIFSASFTGNEDYYFLRLTQEDGDVAVTAPVWLENFQDMGIGNVNTDPEQLAAGQSAALEVTVYNHEPVELVPQSLQITENGTVLCQTTDLEPLGRADMAVYTLSHTWSQPGQKQIRILLTGSVDGETRQWTRDVTLLCQSAAADDGQQPVRPQTIAQARAEEEGTCVCVTGIVTAGNTDPDNCFPGTLYLQDETGGIAVRGSFGEKIAPNDTLTVTGCLRLEDGNLVLDPVQSPAISQGTEAATPVLLTAAQIRETAQYGGCLGKVRGEVVSLIKTEDELGVSAFTLRDAAGQDVQIRIETHIKSSTFGTNDLAAVVKMGRSIEAAGLVHVSGLDTVLRVRDCAEVVDLTPAPAGTAQTGKADPTNPKTGDRLFPLRRLIS